MHNEIIQEESIEWVSKIYLDECRITEHKNDGSVLLINEREMPLNNWQESFFLPVEKRYYKTIN